MRRYDLAFSKSGVGNCMLSRSKYVIGWSAMSMGSGKVSLWFGADIEKLHGPFEAVFAGSTVLLDACSPGPQKGDYLLKVVESGESEQYTIVAVSEVPGESAGYFQLRVSASAGVAPSGSRKLQGLGQMFASQFGVDPGALLKRGREEPEKAVIVSGLSDLERVEAISLIERLKKSVCDLECDANQKSQSLSKLEALQSDPLISQLLNKP